MSAEQQAVAPSTRGRKPTRDWEAEKQTIELLIKIGYTTQALAKTCGLTRIGMHKVLRRLGLRTDYKQGQRA
jgi:hypothetical protein